ncbi:MAG: hypothetical protein CSA81_07135 [Acidobacteria bacterium]|nr:MAG: hypothetical protein CSA81_07135 [Acidobacteriota bacterium]PIE89472.1 MAG: hypothetical protein CR997_10915 [Acidobacteriota bacterium]
MKTRVIVLFVAVLGLWSCTNPREEEAKRIYDKAVLYSDTNEFDKAKELFLRIITDYNDTSYAGKSEKQIIDIDELFQLLNSSKQARIEQKFSQIAVALDNFRARNGFYPVETSDLSVLPDELVPEFEDEEDGEIIYRPYNVESTNKNRPDGYVLAYYGQDRLPGGRGLDQDYFYQSQREIVEELILPE